MNNSKKIKLPPARYEYGGDEFVFVQLDQAMSLSANFKAVSITQQLREKGLPGIIDICHAHASYMVRVNPDKLHPDNLIAELKKIEESLVDEAQVELRTRVIDIPVMYQDPWTHETLMRFRDRHPDPQSTDIEYVARVNGYRTTEDFIAAHCGSPYLVTMVCFTPGTSLCYQLVPPEERIEAAKYVRPRTDTPERALELGGSFANIRPVRGAGGYQLIGMAPAPMFDPNQSLVDFQEFIAFLKPGDIFKYRRIDRDEFDQIRAEVEAGTFEYRKRDFTFHSDRSLEDPKAYNEEILEALYGD